MPLVKFLGFPTGSAVSLAAAQGSETSDLSVSPWNVARDNETLSIAISRAPVPFRRAPEAVWFEAMPEEFTGLTPVLQRPEPMGNADWIGEAATGSYPALGTVSAPRTDENVLIKISNVDAGATPTGLLFHVGSTTSGLAASFDPDGHLVVGAGDGSQTDTTSSSIFLTIDRAFFVDGAVDVWIALDVASWTMRAYVYDLSLAKLTASVVGAVEAPAAAPLLWSDSGGVGIGAANGTVRAGVEGGPFTGSFEAVSIWEDQVPADFADPSLPVGYQPDFHEIFYTWEFGDSESTWQYLENVPPQFNEPNRATGKTACHVFSKAGKYTVKCTAYQIKSTDPLSFISIEQEVELEIGARMDEAVDPEGLFDATNTIVMSKGDFTGAPAGIQVTHGPNGTADWRDAVDQIHEHPGYDRQATPIRILVKRGETGIENSVFEYWKVARGAAAGSAGSKGRCDFIYVGTWGEGANPQVRVLSESNNTIEADRKAHAVIIDGIDVIGTRDMVAWNDPVDYTGTDGIHAFMAGDGFDQSLLVTGCRFTDRHAIGWYMRDFGGTGDVSYCFNDCALDGITSWGVLGGSHPDRDGHTRIALLGMRFTDPADVPRYGSFNTPAGSDGVQASAPIRIGHVNGDFVLDGVDCFARFGWSGGNSWEDGTVRPATQSLLRVSEGGRLSIQTRVQVSRVSVEMDGKVFAVEDTGGSPRHPFLGNCLFDRVFHVSDPGGFGPRLLKTWGGHITGRNLLSVYPDMPTDVEARDVRLYTTGELAGADTFVVADYNNTVVCLPEQAAFDAVAIDGDPAQFTVSNNVVYAPSVQGQLDHVDLAPFDPMILFAPRHQGRWEASESSLQTQFATPPETISLFAPLSGSPVQGAATAGYVSLFDLRGNLRGPQASSGALEVD